MVHPGVALTYTTMPSPIGELTLVAENRVLAGVYMDNHKYPPRALGDRDHHGFTDVSNQLREYFDGHRTKFDLPLAARGNEFQVSVWQLLGQIPYGTTTSYGAIANQLGDKNLAQQVGWANGRNPISIIVPCHRVVGADGSLTGYAGGLERKEFLLCLENPRRSSTATLF